jgi:hypothetical protein
VLLRRPRWLVVFAVVVAGLLGGPYAWYRYSFPFGWNHCCDKQLYFTLRNYAESHDGRFPAGEATPEASLSLLYGKVGFDPSYLLCGKTGSELTARQLLSQGKLLGPETCGWNYVDGLNLADDPRLALFWDKEGLGHNGQRLSDGGHIVMFVSGSSEHIPAPKWQPFLDEQAHLRAQRSTAMVVTRRARSGDRERGRSEHLAQARRLAVRSCSSPSTGRQIRAPKHDFAAQTALKRVRPSSRLAKEARLCTFSTGNQDRILNCVPGQTIRPNLAAQSFDESEAFPRIECTWPFLDLMTTSRWRRSSARSVLERARRRNIRNE